MQPQNQLFEIGDRPTPPTTHRIPQQPGEKWDSSMAFELHRTSPFHRGERRCISFGGGRRRSALRALTLPAKHSVPCPLGHAGRVAAWNGSPAGHPQECLWPAPTAVGGRAGGAVDYNSSGAVVSEVRRGRFGGWSLAPAMKAEQDHPKFGPGHS